MELRKQFEEEFTDKGYTMEDLWGWVTKRFNDSSYRMYELGQKVALTLVRKEIERLEAEEHESDESRS
jgi:hypothetical protein